jgi:predicted nucleic acid-binding protein
MIIPALSRMMETRPFLDTNVLVYAFSDADPNRQGAATILPDGGVVSVQVLNEFVDVARRKLRREWPNIIAALGDIERVCGPALAVTAEIQRHAIAITSRHGFRIYDGLVVAAAHAAGCAILLSDDLQHGQRVGGVTITNPFRPPASG